MTRRPAALDTATHDWLATGLQEPTSALEKILTTPIRRPASTNPQAGAAILDTLATRASTGYSLAAAVDTLTTDPATEPDAAAISARLRAGSDAPDALAASPALQSVQASHVLRALQGTGTLEATLHLAADTVHHATARLEHTRSRSRSLAATAGAVATAASLAATFAATRATSVAIVWAAITVLSALTLALALYWTTTPWAAPRSKARKDADNLAQVQLTLAALLDRGTLPLDALQRARHVANAHNNGLLIAASTAAAHSTHLIAALDAAALIHEKPATPLELPAALRAAAASAPPPNPRAVAVAPIAVWLTALATIALL